MNLPSITELPNELTNDIDVVGAEGIVRLLRQADAQIFNGWRENAGLYDDAILFTLMRLIGVVGEALRAPERTAIVMSGAGTSGRLAFFVAREFNKVMRGKGQSECFHYLMAGGDKALIRAQEGAEDDPVAAVRDLARFEKPGVTVIYIGITCGCSAPYIAAQLDYTMTKPNYVSVLLGFNPLERARRVPIERWDKTFHDVMSALATYDDDRHFILNPVVGPEPVTGSTRMKSGTATKLLLELVFSQALAEISNEDFVRKVDQNLSSPNSITPLGSDDGHPYTRYEGIISFLKRCEVVLRETYLAMNTLPPLIESAGDTLRMGGHIYYLGQGEDSFGILGLVDASECPPTYGADFADVRGFAGYGWDVLENREGDLSREGELYQISISDFVSNLLPGVGENDLIIFLKNGKMMDFLPLDLAETARAQGAKLACISISIEDIFGINDDELDDWLGSLDDEEEFDDEMEDDEDGDDYDDEFGDTDDEYDEDDGEFSDEDDEEYDGEDDESVNLDSEPDPDPVLDLCDYHILVDVIDVGEGISGLDYYAELSCKWILNAITTGAHILKGKVFQNRMIDLRISNNKLYYRSIGIISQLMGVDEETGRLCLLRSIYGTDELSEAMLSAPISRHIEAGTTAPKIVPTALLLATGQFTVAGAREALAADPIVRNIIKKYVAK